LIHTKGGKALRLVAFLAFMAKKYMAGKPVITIVNASNPMIFHEFEKEVEGILLHFGVQDQAILDILSGKAEPSALLPIQMPADMKTVELQFEDVPHDMECHVDELGNRYDFAFGLNWSGVINDNRTGKYRK
jgi:beta-glucosidase